MVQLQLEEADEAKKEAQQIVQRLQDEFKFKKVAVAEVEKKVGPLLKEAQQLEMQVCVRFQSCIPRTESSCPRSCGTISVSWLNEVVLAAGPLEDGS